MQTRILKTSLKYSILVSFLAISCFLLSCKAPILREPYLISKFHNIQKLEKVDHRFCSSLNLNSGKNYSFKSDLYWRCRLSLAKNKLRKNNTSQQNIKYNFQVNNLISKISLNLSETQESVFIKENKKLNNRQHQQCVRIGYDSDTINQSKLDDYFLCRKRLIEDQELKPPFGNLEYLKYPNNSYNIGFVIDTRLEEEIRKYKEAKKNYPTCVKYNLRGTNFKRCIKAQDKSRKCLSGVDRKRFKKESKEKKICQKKSYVEFPDSFLKEEDKAKKKRENVRKTADAYNQNDFASLGIHKEDFEKFSSEDAIQKEKKEKTVQESINSKNELYSKEVLTRLRQGYIFACHKQVDVKLIKYANNLRNICKDMAKFETIE